VTRHLRLEDAHVVEIWAYGGRKYEINSYYSVPDDSWLYELSGLADDVGTPPCIAVAIEDATPDSGEFTSKGDQYVLVRVASGQTPWAILNQFVDLVSEDTEDDDAEDHAIESNGHLVVEPVESGWAHGSRQFDVAVIKQGDNGYPRCELYEIVNGERGASYLEVRGDATVEPDGVVLVGHGENVIPWPVFRRFLDTADNGGKP